MAVPTLTLTRPTAVAAVPVTGVLQAGAARVDLTPGLGRILLGHGPTTTEARGTYGRLFANVLVLDDGHGERVALVQCDLHGGSRWITERIAEHVAPTTGLTTDRVLLAASHTHRGPGAIYANQTYDRVAGPAFPAHWDAHFDQDTADVLAARIAAGVEQAVQDLAPARVGTGTQTVWGHTWNRSGCGLDGLQLEDDRDPDDFLKKKVPRLSQAQALRLAERFSGEVPPRGIQRARLEEASELADPATLEARLRERLGDEADALLGALQELATSEADSEEEPQELREAEVASPYAEYLSDVLALLDDPLEAWDLALDQEARPDDTLEALLERVFVGDWVPAAGLVLKQAVHLRRRRQVRRKWDHLLVDARVHAVVAVHRDRDEPIGAFCVFGATSTLVGGGHPVYCGDALQEAAQWVRTQRALAGQTPFPVGIAGGSLGDVNVYPPGVGFRTYRRKSTELDQVVEWVRDAGKALGEGIAGAIRTATLHPDLRIRVAFAEPDARGARFEPRRLQGERTLAAEGRFGGSTLRGSDLGRSPLRAVIVEGLLADKVHSADPHYPKVNLPRLEAPPHVLPMRLVTLAVPGGGNVAALAGVPAEISTALAAQTRRALQARLGDHTHVVVASPCGEFGGYFGTVWEYLAQPYEGASTLWGRWSGEWCQHWLEALADGGGAAPAPTATFLAGRMPTPVLLSTKDEGAPRPNRMVKHPEVPGGVLSALLGESDPRLLDFAGDPDAALDLQARWVGPRPDGSEALWDGPIVTLCRRSGGGWSEVRVGGVPITDVTTNALLWCEVGANRGTWLLRWTLDDLPADVAALDLRDLAVRIDPRFVTGSPLLQGTP